MRFPVLCALVVLATFAQPAVATTWTFTTSAQVVVDGPFATPGSYGLVPNGDFEDPARTVWNNFDNEPAHLGVNDVFSSEDAFTGAHSAKFLTLAGANGNGYSSRFGPVGFTFHPGITYVLGAFFNTEHIDGAYASVDFGAPGSFVNQPAIFGVPGTVGWHFVYQTFTVDQEFSDNIQIRFYEVLGSANDYYYLDAISVTPLTAFVAPTQLPASTEVPEPTSATALLLFVLAARRAARR